MDVEDRVRVPKLIGSNYRAWKATVYTVLDFKDLVPYIEQDVNVLVDAKRQEIDQTRTGKPAGPELEAQVKKLLDGHDDLSV